MDRSDDSGTLVPQTLSRDSHGFLNRRADVRIVPGSPGSEKAQNTEVTEKSGRLVQDDQADSGEVAEKRQSSPNSGYVGRRGRHPQSVEAALAAGADRSGGPGACWPWLGGRSVDGYGRLYSFDDEFPAHRCALEQRLGRPLAPGMFALHTCDNPPCVNGTHLFEGTKAVNNADCRAKGRHAFGERVGTSKLTAAQVADLRALAAAGGHGIFARLARKFGISNRAASYIAKGQRWAHLGGAS